MIFCTKKPLAKKAERAFLTSGDGNASMAPPGAAAEQDKNGENLDSTENHTQGENQFAEIGENREIAHGTDQIQTGANVANASNDGGQGGGERKVIKRNQQECKCQDKQMGYKVNVSFAQCAVIDYLAVQLYHMNRPRVDGLADLLPQALEKKEDACAFHAAAGGTGAGADKHQQYDDTAG